MKKPVFVTQPSLPPLEEFIPYLQKIWNNKWLTNNGEFHRKFEAALAEYLGVKYVSLFTLGHSFEAWDGDELAGLIVAYINDDASKSAFITYVRTAPEYRGQGVASCLLTECLESIKGKFYFTSVFLEVARNNSPAISLYEKFGFFTFRESESSFFMKKDL